MNRRTLVEIADQLNVSIATVSRALNDAPGVSRERREQVLALANQLGYFPNASARRLQGRRINTLCYAVDVSTRPAADLFFFKDFITVLADRCAYRNLDLLIHPITQEIDTISGIERLLRSGRADGVILSDARTNDERARRLHEINLPFVMFGRCPELPDHPWVDTDGRAGIRRATEHLIQNGHRRIGLLGLPHSFSCALDRAAGYHDALAAAGIAANPGYEATDLHDSAETRAAMLELLSLPNRPTAFVATSDMIALQATIAASQHGLRAGRDYAITGFDDLPIVEHVVPALTSMRQPLEKICDGLIAILLQVLDNESGERHMLFEPELIVRESSGGSVEHPTTPV